MGSLLIPNDNIQDIQRKLEMGVPGGKEEKKARSQKKQHSEKLISIDTCRRGLRNLSSVEHQAF